MRQRQISELQSGNMGQQLISMGQQLSGQQGQQPAGTAGNQPDKDTGAILTKLKAKKFDPNDTQFDKLAGQLLSGKTLQNNAGNSSNVQNMNNNLGNGPG
jgi:hypothetical protein